MVNRRVYTILGAAVLLIGGAILARSLLRPADTVERVQAALPSSTGSPAPLPPAEVAAVAAEPRVAPAPSVEGRSAEAPPAAEEKRELAPSAAAVTPRATPAPPRSLPATPAAAPRSQKAPSPARDKGAGGSGGLTDFGGRIY